MTTPFENCYVIDYTLPVLDENRPVLDENRPVLDENRSVIEYASPLSKRIWGKGVAVSVASCGMFGVAVVLEKTCV